VGLVEDKLMHVYQVRPRKDKRGVDLISDALPFGTMDMSCSLIAAEAFSERKLSANASCKA
jgi:hypothetical protein